uniref:Minor capsid protein P8 central region domain-containing protein n=1 Tax=viral metagenome TaxID=1070528 RepID=A0A6C0HRV1_9ZZZZ
MIQPNTQELFKMYDKIPVHQITTIRDPLNGVWSNTQLSTLFFSANNVTIIQNGIRANVYKMSKEKYLIDNQDNDQLVTIMRGMFIEYSKNLPENITEQIKLLNNKVIVYCSQQVYEEAKGYLTYLKDSSTLITPLNYPTMPYTRDKQLEFKSFF